MSSKREIESHCSECKQELLQDAGDLWFFLLILDRTLLIFPLVVAVYFQWHEKFFWPFVIVGSLGGVVFLLTTHIRNRLCLYFYLRFEKRI